MAVHRLPSIMNAAFHDRDATAHKYKDTTELERLDTSAKRDGDRQSDPSPTTRSPGTTLKRPAYAFPLDEDHHEHASDARMSFDGFAAVLSPAQRKRRRGDSYVSPSNYGSVRITATSIHAVVREDAQRRSMTSDDGELYGRNSWAGTSSRGSGRDSDLWDDMVSPRTEADLATDDRGSASRNITFAMLQTHFSKPLKDAANHFGVCTTLLKKICRKNGIQSWPYRQIIGLEKSIASMEQQVHYFDGEQRRQYAAQLQKLRIKLDAYIRTGQAPGEDELAAAVKSDDESTPVAPRLVQENYQQPPVGSYYHAPQGSVMASAVTLDTEEPLQRYQPQDAPLSAVGTDLTYDQRYAGTPYPFLTVYNAPRPLPSLASLLGSAAVPPQQPAHYANADAPRNEYTQHWHREI